MANNSNSYVRSAFSRLKSGPQRLFRSLRECCASAKAQLTPANLRTQEPSQVQGRLKQRRRSKCVQQTKGQKTPRALRIVERVVSAGRQLKKESEEESCLLRATPDTSSKIANVLLANREKKDIGLQIRAELEPLDARIERLDREIFDLDYRIEDLNIAGASQAQHSIPGMRQSLAGMRDRRAELEDRQEHLQELLGNLNDGGTSNYAGLFVALDELFVSNSLLPPYQALDVSGNTRPSTATDATRLNTDPGAAVEPASCCSTGFKFSEGRRSVQRKAGSFDLREAAERSPQIDPAPESVSEAEEELKRDYQFNKLCVGQAEIDFESRHERFDQEYEDFHRRRAAGESTESIIELDMRQLKETQRLTRAFAEAEGEYYEAKEAAIIAGVQLPGSKIESGFVDDVEDGYRISFETEMQASTDTEMIQKWLDCVRDTGTVSADSERVDKGVGGPPKVDEWDAKSIDLCDSRSMMAEGPWKRRIDKYRAVCKAFKEEWCEAEARRREDLED